MKKLIIVYSPRSARFSEVTRKVIEPARDLKGWMVSKFEVREAPVAENAARLSKVLSKGDLVLSAGGDGTASMCVNAIMKSEKMVYFAVMPFGNFNDYAETLGRMDLETIVRRFEQGKFSDFYPLEIRVNDKHYTYAGMYFTVGLMAEAERIFKNPRTRRKLVRARSRLGFSARKLFGWYVKNKHRKDFLPATMTLNGKEVPKVTTDYVAMNGKNMAGVVPGKGWFDNSEKFWGGTMKSRSLVRLFSKFLKALGGKLPGSETTRDVLEFVEPYDIYVHAEGEGEQLTDVKKLEIEKRKASIRVITA